ncbi:MAG: uroporphyrinogen-III C-methyltransferase [Methylococcales bacterium]|nr:uroporphyrinogen-III C-methyltransferase [Methylococcales bacterium]
MTELNEKQAHDLSDDRKAHRSRSGFWFGIIILLIIIGLAGAGFYLLQGLRDQQKDLGGEVKGEMSKQLSDYQAQLTAIQSQLANVSREVSSKDEHFNKTLADFSQLHEEKLQSTQKELNASIQQIQRQLGKTRGDWLIADAEYLLSVANERLHLIGDTHTTLEALEAADQRLRESGDTGVIKVREKIAEEITIIKNISVPDIIGIYVAIQSQQDHVDQLTLLLPFAGKAPVAAPKENTSEDKGILDSLGVKYSEQPIEEILTAEEAKFIYEQLRVKLEMAQLALVQHNEVLFQSTLADAKKWIEQHFTKNTASSNFIAELDKYSAIKIHGDFPDISLSLKMLKDISKLRIEADKAEIQPAQTEAKKSAEVTKPVEVVKPAEETKPAEPVKPAEETKPVETTKPVDAVKPTKPTPATKAAPAKR